MTKLPIIDEFTDPTEVRRSAHLMLACVLTLLTLGAVMVFSAAGVKRAERTEARQSAFAASPAPASLDELQRASLKPLASHLCKVLLGLGLLFAAARMDYRRWVTWSRGFYFLTVVLLILVLVPGIGAEINGARRWFRPGFLPFALQPSEIAKLAVIVYLAAWFSRTPDLSSSFRHGFLPGVLAVSLPASLILIETDVGTFLLVSMLGFSLMMLAGAKVLHFVLLGSAAIPLLVYFIWQRLPYVVDRFTGFQDPSPTSQVGIALSAMSAGGLTGVGLGAGRSKLFYLAEAENDFILSVVGEELGFLGSTLVVALFAVLFWSGARILLGVRNRFGFFLVAGVLITIVTQTLINLAVATASVPVKGMPLPFVSAGGSSLTILCLGVGMILSVARNPDRPSVQLGEAVEPPGAMA